MDIDNVQFWNKIYDSGIMAWGNTVSTFLEEVEPMLSKGCKILDLGCGNGRNSASLDSKGFDVTGLEFSHSAIEQAKNRCNAKFIQEDLINSDNWTSEVVDVIIDFGFYHFYPADHRVRYLKNVNRILKKGGLYINESGRWADPSLFSGEYVPPQLFKEDFDIFENFEKVIFRESVLPPVALGNWGEYPCWQMVLRK